MGTNNPYSYNDNENMESSAFSASGYKLNGEEQAYYNQDIYNAGTVQGLAGLAVDKTRENTAVVTSLFCMCVALMISGVTAFVVAMLATSPTVWVSIVMPCFILEFIAYIFASWALKHRHAILGGIGFLAYSVTSGITLSCVFIAYDLGNIVTVFIICAIMFAGMAIFGLVTKIDLRPLGSFFCMTLIGLLVMMLVNWFAGSAAINNLIGAVGVVVFAGITAYDIQRIRDLGSMSEGENMLTIGMYGGMMLYLDFINLFLKLLRLFGRGRD